jgi:hypothetical protein
MAPLSEQLLSLRTPAKLRNTSGKELDNHITKVILKELSRTKPKDLAAGDDKAHPDLLEVRFTIWNGLVANANQNIVSIAPIGHATVSLHTQCPDCTQSTIARRTCTRRTTMAKGTRLHHKLRCNRDPLRRWSVDRSNCRHRQYTSPSGEHGMHRV